MASDQTAVQSTVASSLPNLANSTTPLRVAVVGSGPVGIYAPGALMKSGHDVAIDLYECLPVPFGPIHYGVAPDHPRIKGVTKSLHRVLDKPQVRLLGNVNVGKQVSVDELRQFCDAIILATGTIDDRDLDIPGLDLLEHYGAGEFVGSYDSHPEFARDWELSAESAAVVGIGNMGLDVVRILARAADELHVIKIADNVYDGLAKNAVRKIYVFGRRDPAQAKFTPLELRELDHSDIIEVVANPEDTQYDAASETSRRESKIIDQVYTILEKYVIREPKGAPHKLFIYFFESPTEIIGETGGDGVQYISIIHTGRAELDGEGGVRGTGKFTEWSIDAVYRVVGYRSNAVTGVPSDTGTHIIPDAGGCVLGDVDGNHLQGLYTTGWIRHGSVGLIGNAKGDANETVDNLIADWGAGCLAVPAKPTYNDVDESLVDKGPQVTIWEGWHALDAAERATGEAEGREHKKLVERVDMVTASMVVVKQPDANDAAEAVHEAAVETVAS